MNEKHYHHTDHSITDPSHQGHLSPNANAGYNTPGYRWSARDLRDFERFFPGAPIPREGTTAVQALQHARGRSGLKGDGSGPLDAPPPVTIEQLVGLVKAQRTDAISGLDSGRFNLWQEISLRAESLPARLDKAVTAGAVAGVFLAEEIGDVASALLSPIGKRGAPELGLYLRALQAAVTVAMQDLGKRVLASHVSQENARLSQALDAALGTHLPQAG